MAKPKKTRKKWKREPGRPKERLKIILEALAESPDTFEKLCERTGLARTTLSEGLAELEGQGSVERKIEPPMVRGRGKKHRIIIQLSEKELDPIARTLRYLEHLTAIPKIDVGSGKALLTDNVVKTVLKTATLERASGKWTSLEEMREEYKEFLISTFGSDEKIPENMKEDPYKTAPPCKLTDYLLLKALARYIFERGVVSDAIRGVKSYFIVRLFGPEFFDFLGGKNLKIYQKKIKNPEMFPVMTRVKKAGVSKEFDELLTWIKPLVKGENLAAHVFSQERMNHYRELFPVWREFYRAPQSRGEKEKEGGENP